MKLSDFVDRFRAKVRAKKKARKSVRRLVKDAKRLKERRFNPAGTKLIKRFASQKRHQGGALSHEYIGQVPLDEHDRRAKR